MSSDTFRTGTNLERIVDELQKRQISGRIKLARETAGLTQRELGDLLDPPVEQRTIANYESIRVPWGYLDQIAKLTRRNADWLMYGDGAFDLRGEIADLRAMTEQILRRLSEEDGRASEGKL